MTELVTRTGIAYQVSDEDVHRAQQISWHMHHKGYLQGWCSCGKKLRLHQHLGYSGYDHRDRDKLNNKRDNFRLVTNQQNVMNTGPRSGTYKGVSLYRDGIRFVAQIMVDGKKKHLGLFNPQEEAARVYDRAAFNNFGEFAYLNFPLEDEGSAD